MMAASLKRNLIRFIKCRDLLAKLVLVQVRTVRLLCLNRRGSVLL